MSFDYSSMSVEEISNLAMSGPEPNLRSYIRDTHPVLRDSFAASARKELLVSVVTGELTPEQALQVFHSQATGLTEGQHGEGVAARAGSEEMEKVLGIITQLNAGVGQMLREMVSEVTQQRTRATNARGRVIHGGTAVKLPFMDIEAEVILAEPEGDAEDQHLMARKYVPARDDGYRFDIWRSSRQCGAIRFQQTVKDFIELLVADERIILVGPPAVGKTSMVANVCSWLQWPMVRFNGNRDVTVQDFVGTYEAKDGNTVWVDGPLPQAMRTGAVLVLDEADHMPAECTSVLHAVLEHQGRLMITSNGGEVVVPHPNFRIVATANTAGYGDETGLHTNAQMQDFAFISRFDVAFRVDWPTIEHEAELLTDMAGVSKAVAVQIAELAAATRTAAAEGTISYPVTLRQTMAWGRAMARGSSAGSAFAVSVLNKASENDAGALAEMAERVFGDAIRA